MTDGAGTAPRCDRPDTSRQPGWLRRWCVRPLVWSLAVLAVGIFVLQLLADSPRGREWARRWVEAELQARLDHPVSVGRVSFVLLPFTLEAWDVRIAGGPAQATASGPSGEAHREPFLVLPHAVVDLELASLRRGRAHLQRLRLERPEVHLEWYDPAGDNLVGKAPGRGAADTRWDVWIDRVEIDQARVFLDHDRIDLSLTADSIRTRLQGRGPLMLYGQTTAQEVEVRLPNARPLRLAVSASGSIQRGRLDVEHARIRRAGVAAEVTGGCLFDRSAWDQRKCTWHARGRADGRVLDELDYFSELRGEFDFDGELAWRPGSSGWRGTVSASELKLWDRRLRGIAGVLVADRYGVRLEVERATYAGGALRGNVEVDAQNTRRPLAVSLQFDDLRLDDLLADQGVPVAGVASELSGRVRYRCELSPDGRRQRQGDTCRRGDGRGELVVSTDAGYAADLATRPARVPVALEGAFPVRIEAGVVRVDSLRLSNPTQSALAAGWYDLARDVGSWTYDLETFDVGELMPLLPLADPSAVPSWLPTAGTGRLSGRLELGRDGPRTHLTLRLENVESPRLDTERAVGSLRADAQGLWDLRLDLGDPLHALHVEGDVPFSPDLPLRLSFDAFRWPMAAVEPWLTDVPSLPLSGEISGRLELELPAESNPQGASSGRLTATLEPARVDVAGHALDFDALAASMSWRSGRIEIRSLDLRAPAGVVSGAGRLELPTPESAGRLELRLASARLDIEQAPLAAWRPRPDLAGTATLRAHLGGTFSRPELELHLAADPLRLGDRALRGESSLDAVWDGGRLGAAARLADALVIEGGGELDLDAADLGFTVRADDLELLLDVLGLRSEVAGGSLGGRVSGEIRVSGPLSGPPDLRLTFETLELLLASAEVDTAEVNTAEVDTAEVDTAEVDTVTVRRLINRRPVVVHCCAPAADDGSAATTLHIDDAMWEDGAGSRFELAGDVRDPFGSAHVDLELNADLDLSWLRLLAVPPIEGRVRVEGRLVGPPTAPDLLGLATLHDGVFDVPGMPQAVTDLQGTVRAEGRHLEVIGIRGRFAGGRVLLAGNLTLATPAQPGDYRLTLDADEIDLRHPDGWSLAGDADLVMTSTETGALVSGRADLQRLGWNRDVRFELGEMLRELFRRRRLEVMAADSTLSRIALNVQLAAPDAVRVTNNLARMTGSADLFLRGHLATPVLYGEVKVEPGGSLVYGGTEYRVERGRILFVDPFVLEAEIDLLATTRVRDFDVTLSAFGNLERLETRFASDPPLPDVDLFRLLAGGDVVEAEAQLLDPRITRLTDDESTSAAGFLYGQAASAIGDRVSHLFGLDKFRIDPLTGSDRDNLSKARVTVGKRLSKDVFLTYSVDPSSNDNQRLQVEWRVGAGLTLVLTQNGDNSYSADARWDATF